MGSVEPCFVRAIPRRKVPKKMAPKGAILDVFNLLFDTDNWGFANNDGTRKLSQLFDFVHVRDNNRSQGRLGFFFQQRQIEFDHNVAFLNALAFFSDAFEALAFQFNGVDTEVDEQLNAAV